jgi:two-component system sensor histidine kinase ChvG
MRTGGPALLHSLSLRLLVFNLLLVFLPAAGLFYLDTYEQQLLQALEHALVQQGRLLASALAQSTPLDEPTAARILRELGGRQEARIRVLGASGELIVDTSRLGPQAEATEAVPDDDSTSVRTRPLYTVASTLIRPLNRVLSPPPPPLAEGEFYSGATRLAGEEVEAALSGRYGAATRISTGGQRSVTLYSAIPVLHGDEVTGVVLVSQSTYRILTDLYDLRLDVTRIFLMALVVAVLLSLFLSSTITRPIHRLRNAAADVLDRRGRLVGTIPRSRRRDEVGDLSRALTELTERLRDRVHLTESLAADVSHELKNPLAAIRSAVEVAETSNDPSERRAFLRIVQTNVARMERLLTELREITHLETDLERSATERVDLCELIAGTVEGARLRGLPADVDVEVIDPGRPVVAWVYPEKIVRVLENVMDNALSFAPCGTTVEVFIVRNSAGAVIEVRDRGPGIAPEDRERVFERFYSDRPGGVGHSGLGLSIARAIVDAHAGQIRVIGCNGGGTVVRIDLPATHSPPGS